ncbi:3-isopropylmalate dehydratase small subunit [Calycomorphotria hydatis]|uniref:3-isopropylmalate dehydratase small subunit n=1 Tax=Calycomorphotria hydatis TaxID=2528027 RepID=UPI0011A1B1A8
MTNIEHVTGSAVPLLLDDIDTDRIIPARYLRCVTFDGLHEHVFKDDRAQDDFHPFDKDHHQDASLLVAGRNFGCGSSREHAPQSLMRWGIEGIVAESYAEIFFGNCVSLGIVAVCVSRENLHKLDEIINNDPKAEIKIDLNTLTVTADDLTVPCEIPESARQALLTGQYDALGQLLDGLDEVESTAAELPYMSGFSA